VVFGVIVGVVATATCLRRLSCGISVIMVIAVRAVDMLVAFE